ncbi:hypothetical protein [Citrobacter sp. Igbk 17]|uniref:hypothetical protein n=1 Tax=Citrobacter sp. Igbk 17 TaxID=2963957 RepID=UPI002302FDAA|nr:hypothetical protein [Citrobacter sp. Igbk 17]MDA8500706.1 hypothetical protein [Citrobacter sp. Igbk 17]
MKPTYEELEQQVLELSVQLANAESKCRELAVEPREDKSGDWVQWSGGDQPVSSDAVVSVIFADKSTDTDEASAFGGWLHLGDCADIISYRQLPSHEVELMAEMKKSINLKVQEIIKLGAENGRLKRKGIALHDEASAVYERINSIAGVSEADYVSGLKLRQLGFVLEHETPATDAFLAEVRAQGVEALVLRRKTAARIARERDDLRAADALEGEACRAQMFADEIRQEAK